jgi:nucleoside-diphosphate-sugar epimerase
MSKIMIVGGAGFIGSHLTKKLTDGGHDVLVYDQHAKYNHEVFINSSDPGVAKKEHIYRLNLTQYADIWVGNDNSLDSLRSAVRCFQPDKFVYAGGISVPAQVTYLTAPGMLRGFLNCMHLFVEEKIPLEKFLFLSSSLVYTQPHGPFEPVKETANIAYPWGLYAQVKKLCEDTLWFPGPFESNIVRLCGVYGPGDGNNRVVHNFINRSLNGERLLVKQGIMNDFTHVSDVVRGLEAVLNGRARSTVYNISAGKAIFLEAVAEKLSARFGTEWEYFPLTPTDTSKGPFSIERMKDDFAWEPLIDFKTGLNTYVEYIQERNKSL